MLNMIFKGLICLGVSFSLAYIPNFDKAPEHYQVVTDDGVIFKATYCGDAEEEKVNPDYRHICRGVK